MATKAGQVMKDVLEQFGDPSGEQILPDDMFRWINEGQLQILRQTTDLLGSQSIPVAIGDRQYSLNPDFQKVTTGEFDGRRLMQLTPAQMGAMYPTIDSDAGPTGAPRHFAIQKSGASVSQLYLAPIPAAAGTLVLAYKSRPALVRTTEDDLSISDDYVPTLRMFCLAKARQLDGDEEAAAITREEYRKDVAEDSHDANHPDDETYPFIRTSTGDYGYGNEMWL